MLLELVFCLAAYLDSAQKHRRDEERHRGCSKIPDGEPGCNVQHQDMTEIQDEKGAVGVEKPHLLHGCTELTEIFYQLFLWTDPRASAGLKMPQDPRGAQFTLSSCYRGNRGKLRVTWRHIFTKTMNNDTKSRGSFSDSRRFYLYMYRELWLPVNSTISAQAPSF